MARCHVETVVMIHAVVRAVAALTVAVVAACGPPSAGGAGEGGVSPSPVPSPTADSAGALQLDVEPSTARPGQDLVLVIRHSGGEGFEYGAEYALHRRTEAGWEPYDECPDMCAWPLWLAIVQPGREGRQDITAPKAPGVYRITKGVDGVGTATTQLRVQDG